MDDGEIVPDLLDQVNDTGFLFNIYHQVIFGALHQPANFVGSGTEFQDIIYGEVVLQAQVEQYIKGFFGKVTDKRDSGDFRPFKVLEAEKLETLPEEVMVRDFLVINKTQYRCFNSLAFKKLFEFFYRFEFFFIPAGKQDSGRSGRGKVMYAFMPVYLPEFSAQFYASG
jgi:hypothetical protein